MFVDGDACVEQESHWKDSSHTQGSCRESELPAGTNFSQNSRLYIVLKLPRDSHAMLVFHWLQLKPTQCLFFIGHGFQPRDACLSLAMVLTLIMLAFHWSHVTPTQCSFFIDYSLYPRFPCFR